MKRLKVGHTSNLYLNKHDREIIKTQTPTILKKIVLDTIQEFITPYSERPQQLSARVYDLLLCEKTVHSSITSPLRRLFTKTGKEKWIKQVSNSYLVGKKSKEYERGELLNALRGLILINIHTADLRQIISTPQDILIHEDNLHKLERFNLLNKIKGKDGKYFVIDLDAKQNRVYLENVGRQYNTFNRMSSSDRLLTTTSNEIDLSTSIQVLLVNQYSLIKEISYEKTLAKFKIHDSYINNKIETRNKISEELNITIKEVKTLITKICFGGELEKKYKIGFLKELENETKLLRKPLIDLINKMDDRLPIKKYIQEQSENKRLEKKQKVTSYRTKLFFWYEYRENEIRRSMLDFISDPSTKQVHDAIYTRELIDLNKLKEHVYKATDLTIKL